jgi:hypothetical protein
MYVKQELSEVVNGLYGRYCQSGWEIASGYR